MSSSSASALPTTGIYEPLQRPAHPVSKTDQGAYALLAAVIVVVLTGLTICVKLQIMYQTFRKWRRDDATLAAALLFALLYTITTCISVDYGLGSVAGRLSSSQMESLSQYHYASNILFFLSLAASKISVALLIIYIQPNKRIGYALYGLTALVILWGVATVFVVAFQCGPNRWVLGPTDTDTCIDQLSAQIGIRAVDILTDIVLATSPAFMMMKVQMSLDKRLVVALMFGLRLATLIFTIISLISLTTYYSQPTPNRPFAAVTPSIWSSVTINISLITACLPSIKRFLADWAAGVTNAPLVEAYEMQHSSNNPTYGQSSGIRSFVRSQPRKQRTSSKSKLGSKMDRSQLDRSQTPKEDYVIREDDSGSQRELTDGIVQTVDYRVEYEDEQQQQQRWDGHASPGGRI